MKFNIPLNNFASGEWSPKMSSRSEIEQYQRAAKSLQNCIVQMQGGAFKRPGTTFQPASIDDALIEGILQDDHLLIPVNLSNGEQYIIIASGSSPWAYYKTDGTDSGLVDVPPGEITLTFNIADLQYAQVGDIVVCVNGIELPWMVAYDGTALNKFFIRSVYGWYNSGVIGDQSGTGWKAFPFGPLQTLGVGGTVTVTGTFTIGGNVTMTATKNLFDPDDAALIGIGVTPRKIMKFTLGGNTGAVYVNTVTSATVATGVVIYQLPGASGAVYGLAAGTAYEMSMWSGKDGFPRAITAFEGRLYYGGTTKYPDTVWGSRIGAPFDMMETPFVQDPSFTGGAYLENNSRPFTITPNSPISSNIVTLSSQKTLLINTDRVEINAYGTNAALGPNNFNFDASTSYGAIKVQPARINSYMTFVQRGGRKLRDISFQWDEQQYKSADISFVADHMTIMTTFKQLVSAELGSSVLFTVMADGGLSLVTLDRDYQINAWAPMRLGGNNPRVVSMCAFPSQTTGQDDVFLTVTREIDGADVTYLEQLNKYYEMDSVTDTVFPHYMDSMVVVTSPTDTNVFSGLDHLEGETVQVILDGAYVSEFVVTAGVVTLPTHRVGKTAGIGLKYKSVVTPMAIELGAQTGSAVGRDKRVNELYIRLYKTLGGKYGIVGQDLFDIPFTGNMQSNVNPHQLKTIDIMVKMPPGTAKTFELTVESDYPFPCNVLAIGVQGTTYD